MLIAHGLQGTAWIHIVPFVWFHDMIMPSFNMFISRFLTFIT